MSSQISASLVLKELIRRKINLSWKSLNLRHPDFTHQNNAIDDKSHLKAYNCTRRAGKTSAIGAEFIEDAIQNPNAKYLYSALTISSARAIFWDEIKTTLDKNNTIYAPNESRLEIRFPNNALIKLFGFDVSEKQMTRILGQKYRKIAIDEAGSMTVDMTRLIYQMLEPTTIDCNGQIILLGTCENIPNTFFQKVTEGIEPGWSVHKWTGRDNPFVAENFDRMITDILARNPLAAETSWFRTHYLNQWCTDDDLLIIPIKEHNYIEAEAIPKGVKHILGIDLGWNDDTSFSIGGFVPHDRNYYQIKSFKHKRMDFTDVGQMIERLNREYPFIYFQIDGANKQGVEELKKRWGHPLESAEKKDKAIFLRTLRDDAIQGYIKIVEKDNAQLITEWSHLIWKDESKAEEDSRCENHLSDATLYAWRKSTHYTERPEDKIPEFNTDEYMEKYEQKLADELTRQLREEKEIFGEYMGV